MIKIRAQGNHFKLKCLHPKQVLYSHKQHFKDPYKTKETTFQKMYLASRMIINV